uniref:PDZ domain-containing protein n=1 Tax=viral metagenome TaxID=1070528 RepID=A0A6C0EB62_9ZZZZ
MSKQSSLYPSLEEFMVQEEITLINSLKTPEKQTTGLELIKQEHKLVLSNPEVYQKSSIASGIYSIQYRKNQDISFTFHDYKSGIFINNLNQPAVNLGLHFGDQIININGISLSGLKTEKVKEHYDLYDNSQLITLMVRDRPYIKVITLTKSPQNDKLGFMIKNGYITDLIKNTSAHLNGLLTDHKLVEINGNPVFHLNDTQIINNIKESQYLSVHLSICPREFYEKITKKTWW